jgi:hypothetical protein
MMFFRFLSKFDSLRRAEAPAPHYFALVAGAAGVVAVFADFLLCFFECFFAGAAVAPLSFVAGACAANESPATARLNERPRTAEVIFFMVSFPVPFEALSFWFRLPPLLHMTRHTINPV